MVKLNNTMKAITLATLLGLGSGCAMPKFNTTYTNLQKDKDSNPENRFEMLVPGRLYDAYLTHSGKFNKGRVQAWLPKFLNHFDLGIVAQSTKVGSNKALNQIGIAGSVKGKVGPLAGRLWVRYFPEQNSFDIYGNGKIGGKVGLTLLGTYNAKNGSYMIRPGVNVSLYENADKSFGVFTGVEIKIADGHNSYNAATFGMRWSFGGNKKKDKRVEKKFNSGKGKNKGR